MCRPRPTQPIFKQLPPKLDLLNQPRMLPRSDADPGSLAWASSSNAQENRQAELGVQALSGVAQVLGDEWRHPKAFIQLAHQNETGVGRDGRPLERDQSH